MEREGIAFEKEKRSGTVVYLAIDGEFAGSILIADEVKDDAVEAISSLKAAGIQTVMLTGDATQVGNAVAQQIGIDEVHAELLPQDKVAKIEDMMRKKHLKKSYCLLGTA